MARANMQIAGKARGEIREKFAEILEAHFVTDLGIVELVSSHLLPSWSGRSPVVALFPGGTGRDRQAVRVLQTHYRLYVYAFAVYSDVNDRALDPEAAQRVLDEIDFELQKVVADNQRVDGFWTEIVQEDFSGVEVMKLGEGYMVEVTALLFTVP